MTLLAEDRVGDVRRTVHRLTSGATLIAEVDPHARTAAAAWNVPVGSWDEPAGAAGASHLLEHLAFKGTLDTPGAELDRRLDAIGADANAWTGEDRTSYHGAVLPERLTELNELLAALLRPAIREEDVATEREVVLEEIAMADDDPDSRVVDACSALAFDGHPLGRPVLGTRASVAGLTAADLRAWRDRHVRPERTTIVLAGRFDPDAERDRIEALLDAWRPAAAAPPDPRTTPRVRAGRVRTGMTGASRVHVATLAPGVGLSDPRRHAADLAAQVLGEPGHGTLHWALVDPGLAESAGLQHEPGHGFGTFGGWFACDPGDEEAVRDGWLQVLGQAQDAAARGSGGSLDPEAWRRAARTLATDAALQAERPTGRLDPLAELWTACQELHDPGRETDATLAATPEQGEALLAERPFATLAMATLVPASAGEADGDADGDAAA